MKHRTEGQRPHRSLNRRRVAPRSARGLLAIALTAATAFCATASLDANAAASDEVASATHSAGASMRDMTLTTKAKAALVGTDGLSSGDVHVSTKQGRVTLTGSVPDEAQKPLAVQAVKSVKGVRSVQDQLTILAK
ncbi:BON domain-containing protein [Burkholderia sp. 22PA0106]|uniref:BON domain-containing protein n=1 Tax=Burkholderia sp. 22PA0106 TaxID=3237371 RepID=UPI0039C37908